VTHLAHRRTLKRLLEQYETNTNASPLVFFCSDQHAKSITEDDIAPIIELCSELQHPSRLHVILHANGGMVHVAQRLGQVFLEHTKSLVFLVPERARSAATLLCFAGQEIRMRAEASLGPIDPMIQTTPERSPGQVQVVSSQDIKEFVEMSSQWFGVSREEYGSTLLNILCQRVFPLSLSSFFRAEKYVREVAMEFLSSQQPNASKDHLLTVVEYFLSKHSSHDALISLAEAQAAGINAIPTEVSVLPLLTEIFNTCKFLCPLDSPRVSGVLATRNGIRLYCATPPSVSTVDSQPEVDQGQLQKQWYRFDD
jgi:Serine dehydrogenase proteinase